MSVESLDYLRAIHPESPVPLVPASARDGGAQDGALAPDGASASRADATGRLPRRWAGRRRPVALPLGDEVETVPEPGRDALMSGLSAAAGTEG